MAASGCGGLAGCAGKPMAMGETKARAEAFFPEYADAVAKAASSASKDEFSRLLVETGTVNLRSEDVKNLSRLRVGKDGKLYVCDFDRKTVSQFDPEGNYQHTFGKAGNEPGSSVFPTSVAETANGSIAVVDFQGYRVNRFGGDGTFQNSFIYTPQSFSAQDLVFNETNGSFYLFGNRWQKNDAGEVTGAQLAHRYSSNGDFIGSQLQFPDKFKELDLYNYSYPSVDTGGGAVYVMLPFDYTVYRLGPNDDLSVFLKGSRTDFKPPTSKLDASKIAQSDPAKSIQSWRLHWTPLANLIVAGDQLIIQYQTFSPLRYTTDIWSISTKKLRSSFKDKSPAAGTGTGQHALFSKKSRIEGAG